MRITGNFSNATYSLNGKALITFEVDKDALEQIEGIKEGLLVIEATKYKEKRSKDANAYFWVLADKIARKVKSDKWSIYLWLVSKYGVFIDLEVMSEAVEEFKDKVQQDFRYIETIEEGAMTRLRCYYGTHTYNKQEMSEIIQGTISEAKELGIDTLTPDEVNEMLSLWKG